MLKVLYDFRCDSRDYCSRDIYSRGFNSNQDGSEIGGLRHLVMV